MGWRLAAATIATLLASVPQAHADNFFADFQTICLDTHASTAEAIATADRLGWMPMSQAMLHMYRPDVREAAPQGRVRSTKKGVYFLLATQGDIGDIPGLRGHACAIGLRGDEAPDFMKTVAAFAGVPRDPYWVRRTVYVWREVDGKHVAVHHNDLEFLSLAENGSLNVLGFQIRDKVSMIAFGIPSK